MSYQTKKIAAESYRSHEFMLTSISISFGTELHRVWLVHQLKLATLESECGSMQPTQQPSDAKQKARMKNP